MIAATMFVCPECRLSLPVAVWPLRCRCGKVYYTDSESAGDIVPTCVYRGELVETLRGKKECGCGNEGVEVWHCHQFAETVMRRKVQPAGRKRIEREHGFAGRYCVTCPARQPHRVAEPAGGIRLLRKPEHILGRGFHRSGWPFAVESLDSLHSPTGIAFEDFSEQRFCYDRQPRPITEPWAGIFHHPHNMPAFANEGERPQVYLAGDAFQRSVPHLRLAICMSEYQAAGFRELLPKWVKVVAIKHPTGDGPRWQRASRVLQVGHYLRNTRLIHLIDTDRPRLKVLAQRSWIQRWDAICMAEFGEGRRVDRLGYVDNDRYDDLLATSVVVTHLLDASANNVVVECVRRNTPIAINRHPAAVEYLGEDYPLFWDSLDQVGRLLTDARIAAAHRYLALLRKPWLEGEAFAASVDRAVQSVIREAAA